MVYNEVHNGVVRALLLDFSGVREYNSDFYQMLFLGGDNDSRTVSG